MIMLIGAMIGCAPKQTPTVAVPEGSSNVLGVRKNQYDTVMGKYAFRNGSPDTRNERNTPMPKEEPESVHGGFSEFGRYYALVIGNNAYRYLKPLATAKNDAREISRLLKSRYGFDVTTLYDATRSDILSEINRFRQTLTEKDNFLIYYAGHGWLDADAEEGYWLPVDAESHNPVNWVSNASVTSALKAMSARHVLIVADSCYSGKLSRGINISIRKPDYLKQMAAQRSRTIMASGGLEPVVDSGGKGEHSVFAAAFMEALGKNTAKAVEAAQLFPSIRRDVLLNADQTPEYSDIRKAGHEGGDFIFVHAN